MGTIQRKIGSSVELKSAAFTAVPGGYYLCNTVNGTFAVTLPSGTAQDMITFSDDARTWGTNNLTIAPASGQTIDGLAIDESLICDLAGAFVTLTWNGTTWTIATNGFASSVSNGSLSSGSGSGSKNYILNTNNITNWAASDAGITVTNETTAANLPDNSTQTTAIKILRASGTTSYARYRFALDQADYSKKFQLSFDMKYAGAAGDYKLEIYSFTSNAYSGGTLITPQTTDIPALSAGGTFTTSVDMPGSTAPYIEFRIRGNGVSTPLYLNNVYAGPGTITQGAAVSEWQSITFATPSNLGTGSATNTAYFQRVGGSMILKLRSLKDGSGGSGASAVTFTMPSGYTINTSVLPASNVLGVYVFDGTNYGTEYAVIAGSSTTFVMRKGGTATNFTGTDFTANGELNIQLTIPISEWAGNGTVNLGQGAQVEYAWNNGTWDTVSETGTFGYGPQGKQMGGTLSQNSLKRIRFQYPIQTDDLITVELSDNGTIWFDASTFRVAGGGAIQAGYSEHPSIAGGGAGITWGRVTGSSTDVDVLFGKYRWIRLDGGYSDAWSSSFYWRVRKAKASSPVGFGLAGTDGSSGLYKAGQAPGLTTGAAIAAGYVGEETSASATSISIGTSEADIVSLTLTTGIWLVSATSYSDGNTGVIGSTAYLYVKGSNSNTLGKDVLKNYDDGASGVRLASSLTFGARPVTILSADVTKTVKIRGKTASGTSNFSGFISAVRIA